MREITHGLGSMSLTFVEQLYAAYLREPESVPPDWQVFFAEQQDRERTPFSQGVRPVSPLDHGPAPIAMHGPAPNGAEVESSIAARQYRVDQLIRAYRTRGYRAARLDPLGRPLARQPELDPAYHGLSEDDMDRLFSAGTLSREEPLTLRQILSRLKSTYCRSIGVQFMHIDSLRVREWLQKRMERSRNRIRLDRQDQIRILTRLTDAVYLEEFIQRKFTGAKRFSLEGAESLIPLLDLAIEKAGEDRIKEVVLGMAHRGRLNVLANIMGKSPRFIFSEFEDVDAVRKQGRGDVKYHQGYQNDWHTASGHSVHLALCFNPSHLEFVNPVALGRTRAKQDRLKDLDRDRYMVILVHGDAAFAGEGIVQETLNLSQLDGYAVGGTLHVIVNNQIGFTTGPEQGRSSVYAADIARMLHIPIFHVNGEDPEAVAQVVRLAMDFRRTFKRDAVIDMYCYRRRGHNEGDEPAFTHPAMYRAIEKRPSVRDGYLGHLLELGEVSREEADHIADRRREALEQELSSPRTEDTTVRPSILGRVWSQFRGGPDKDEPDVDTGVKRERLASLLERLSTVPPDFHPHPKIERLLEQRLQMARGEKPLDWAAGEALAFGSLAIEGTRVRLTGQDSERGTFSHRHAVLHDVANNHVYVPLQRLATDQGPVTILNSPLSEAGVLGFEYGYSIAYPDALVVWEAQFGDFCNVAQVIVDQFIASAEDKWGSLSGLVMLLPHGFEGMGPEHSSARLERFLSLAAEDNIQIVQPSTPAQMFHVLRRQVLRRWRKPLVIMTPKSMLRHPRAVSALDELAQGSFRRVLPDAVASPDKTRRVLLCSGKLYYELDEERRARNCEDVAIVRLEQYYPLQEEALRDALAPYAASVPVYWTQEEPENMGAWRYLFVRFGAALFGRSLRVIARPESASPATGSAACHKAEQRDLMDRAFGEAEREG
ncbi:MAG TPA: 2-oxoglutarate dehydrogenase E1 component [Candidatus Hydrogenedentes bacterium]|nr:2-oxoglutarate dehydrogenase E1 component [Candidatus Hydrogenedentota bacterium]HOS02543.1 2-oxoglutarate dehydrogenase E1 component [Candidatus Hydrogenedentota bacterium]